MQLLLWLLAWGVGQGAAGCPFNITDAVLVESQVDWSFTKSVFFPDGWAVVRLQTDAEFAGEVIVRDAADNTTYSFNSTSLMALAMPVTVPTPFGWQYTYECDGDQAPSVFRYFRASGDTERSFNFDSIVGGLCTLQTPNIFFETCMDSTNNNILSCQMVCMSCAVCWSSNRASARQPPGPPLFNPCPSGCGGVCTLTSRPRAICPSCTTPYASGSCLCASNCNSEPWQYTPGSCPVSGSCTTLTTYPYLDAKDALVLGVASAPCASCTLDWRAEDRNGATCSVGACSQIDSSALPAYPDLTPSCSGSIWIDGCQVGDQSGVCGDWSRSSDTCYGNPIYRKFASFRGALTLYVYPRLNGGGWTINTSCDPLWWSSPSVLKRESPAILDMNAPHLWSYGISGHQTNLTISTYCLSDPPALDPNCITFNMECTNCTGLFFCGMHFASGTAAFGPVCNGGPVYRSSTSDYEVRKLPSGAWAVVSVYRFYGSRVYIPSCGDQVTPIIVGPTSLGGMHTWTAARCACL